MRIEGSVADPSDWSHGEYRLKLQGRRLDELEALTGVTLPEAGPYGLHAAVRFNLDEYLMVSDLTGHIGASDIHGHLHWDMSAARPAIKIRLDSQQWDAGDMGIGEPLKRNANQSNRHYWDQPLDIGVLRAIDFDVGIQIQRLDGLAKPMRDIILTAQADRRRLKLAVAKATVDETQIAASAVMPWDERLTTLAPEAVSPKTLLEHAELDIRAQAPNAAHQYATTLMGHPVDLTVSTIEAAARPGAALTIRAEAALNDEPVTLNLQGEPLGELVRRPTGPWQELAVEVQGGDIRFQATGSVDRPFEARGFDIHYALRGAEIDTLLPLFDLVLPLEGPYSLTGHFADLPDRTVFDELKIISGNSDIGGHISVYQGKYRPRVAAKLNSEQIYLSEFLPITETKAAPETELRVIPDYNLPIEPMRQIDGELQFKGKRLRTAAGDLGDISFTATLRDGVFNLDPFRVRGWAGALIESDAMIDASQNPPAIALQWVARQLNYGLLLEQAGLGETVEGHLDITLRLSGSGRTRHEFLSEANGQLVIVGKEGKFGSRRLDLWGSDLVTTMLSREWRRQDVTDLNCAVARISIEDGMAKSDNLLIDSRRITIGAAGTLDLESEELDLVIAPSPKRASLVSLTNPVRVTGTLAAPEVAVTVLPRNRMATAGGLLAGLINPGFLIFTFAQMGSGEANPCVAAIEKAMEMKGMRD